MTIKEIIFHFKNVFNGQPWYGKSIYQILSQINYSDDSIIVVIHHMLAWRKFAISQIKNENVDIKLNSKEDWPEPGDMTIGKALEAFEQTNDEIISNITSKPEIWLRNIVKSSKTKYDFQFLLEGVIQHDIYHLGQIALLHKQHVISENR